MTAPLNEQILEIAAGRIRVRTFGSSTAPRAVMALHGYAQTADFLARLAEELLARQDVYVVAPDLPAHGDSEVTVNGSVDEVLSNSIVEVWQRMIGRSALWFGNSLGARVAAFVCGRVPEAAERLVLGETVTGLEQFGLHLIMLSRHLTRERPAIFSSIAEAQGYAQTVSGIKGRALELWTVHALRPVPGGWAEKLDLRFLDPVYWPLPDRDLVARRLANVRAPVRLVYGGAKSILSLSRQKEVSAMFGGAPITHLSGAGHDLFLDAPEELAEIILREAI